MRCMLRKQVYLTPEEEAKLKRLARATGRTEAEILRVAGRGLGLSKAVLADREGR